MQSWAFSHKCFSQIKKNGAVSKVNFLPGSQKVGRKTNLKIKSFRLIVFPAINRPITLKTTSFFMERKTKIKSTKKNLLLFINADRFIGVEKRCLKKNTPYKNAGNAFSGSTCPPSFLKP
jgi:hypothetical protein